MANTNANTIADGVPMNLEQMREYLQEYHGVPIGLRQQGETAVKCPYCNEMHHYGPETGHHEAGCDESVRSGVSIIIGERYFVPSYGITIYEYRTTNTGVNELIVPENLN